jgi:hypothetical protein
MEVKMGVVVEDLQKDEGRGIVPDERVSLLGTRCEFYFWL